MMHFYPTNNKNCNEAENAAKAAKPKVYRLKPQVSSDENIYKKNYSVSLEKVIIEEYTPQNNATKIGTNNSTFFNLSSSEKKILVEEMNRPARFFTFGCQGDGKKSQLEVAKSMNDFLSDPNVIPPDFILLLGDNFYDFGVNSANDEMFTSTFYDIYYKPEFKHLRKIPCFAVLGNHDENIHKMGNILSSLTVVGIEKGMHQVAHTYFPNEQYKSTEELKKLYRSHIEGDSVIDLNLEKLPPWNMPSRTYSLISGCTQIFCIDSNTYVSDYLKARQGDNDKYNQANWLVTEVMKAKKAGRQVILALHHPLVTPGKRVFDNDIHLYLTEDELNSEAFIDCYLNLLQAKNISYNQLMYETLRKQQLVFDLVLTAHDHDMYYYNNKNSNDKYTVCQLTSGGGGGKLQNREDFTKQVNMGCFLKRHGFIEINCPIKQPIEFFIHSLPKSENDLSFLLHFNTDDCIPIRNIKNEILKDEEEAIQKIYSVVMSAISEYFQNIAPLQIECGGNYLSGNVLYSGNLKHGYTGVERVHKIWAYLSNYHADDYVETIKNIYALSRWESQITSPSPHSFITLLNEQIAVHFGGHSMESLFFETMEVNAFHLI